MPLSAAEKQRRYRERKKSALEKAPDTAGAYLKRPISDFLDGRILEFDESLDSLGIRINGDLHEDEQTFHSDGLGEVTMSGLERLTGLAGVFLDAARELHELVNAYKLSEIDARIAEIEGADLADPAARKQALADIVRLNAIRGRLSKEFRRSFPEINVKELP